MSIVDTRNTNPNVPASTISTGANVHAPGEFGTDNNTENFVAANTQNLNTLSSSGISSSAQPTINSQTQGAVTGSTNNLMGNNQNNNSGYSGSNIAYSNPGNGNQNTGISNVKTDANGNSTTTNYSTTPAQLGSNSGDVTSYLYGLVQNSTGQQIGSLNTSYQLSLQNAAIANQQLQLQYNTGLGSLNTQYQQAYQQLNTQHQNSIGSAISQIATADPFGTNASSANTGYINKINDMYSQQATFLTNSYNQQQVALTNGEIEGALGIQQSINNAQSSFSQNLASVMSGMNSALVGITQQQQSKTLQSQSLFESNLKSTDLYNTKLPDGTQLSSITDPNDSKLQDWIKTSTLGQQGLAAGYTPEQIGQSIVTGTNAQVSQQQKAQSLNLQEMGIQLRAQQVGIEQTRLMNTQNVLGQVNSLGQLSADATSDQKSQYYSGIAQATGSSIVPLSSDYSNKLSAGQSFMSLVPTLEDAVNNTSNISGIAAKVATMFPEVSTNITSFNALATSITGAYDKATGSNTTAGLTKIITGASTPATRQNALNYIKNTIGTDFLTNIKGAASSAQNVSGFASSASQAASLTSGSSSNNSGTTSSGIKWSITQ